MKNIKVVNSVVVVGFVLMLLAAAGLSGGFGLLTGSAASGTKAVAGDYVPDGLSSSDWNGIRAAYEAGRPRSIESIGQEAYLKPAAVGTTQASDNFGTSVAVAGDTVVVGAAFEDSSTTGVNSTPNESAGDSGAAYVLGLQPPTLGVYPATVDLSDNITVTPGTAPTNTTSISVSTSTSFNGRFEADVVTGVVRLTNAQPAKLPPGAYTVRVRAFGPGGFTDRTFMLTVTTPPA